MTDDATLTDFAADEPGDDGAADDAADAVDGGADEASVDSGPIGGGSVDSGLSTYAWGEYTCDRCDDETDRVWREDGTLVCPDCKSW